MNRRIFFAVATAFVILPLGVNAAHSNLQNNNLQNNNSQTFSSSLNQVAQNHLSRGKRQGRGERMGKLLQQLDLTSEQSQQIEAIREQSRTENDPLYQEMQANREQMRSLFTDDASSEQLRQQHQKIQVLSQQLGDNRFEMMLQVREVLTPEQRTQMAALMSQYQGRRGN